MLHRRALVALCLFLSILVAPHAWAQSAGDIAQRVRAHVETQLGDTVKSALRDLDDGTRSGEQLASLAHGLALNRQFQMAGWLYAAAVNRDPSLASAWSSLGVLMDEGIVKPDVPGFENIRADIVDVQREARRLDGQNPSIAANLGNALFQLGKQRNDMTLVDEGARLLLEAVTANPRDPKAYVHLASALFFMGETSAARKFWEAAYHLNSAHPTLVKARAPGGNLAGAEFVPENTKFCDLSFNCEASCPKSIIGQVDFVTCKISEDMARSNCGAGKPYAQAFDCSAKIPRFGILLPGLDPGFSIVTPWGSFDAVMQGNGRIDFQLKFLGPASSAVQPALRTEGSWEPHNGTLSADFGVEAQYNLFSRVSPVMEQANAYDIGLNAVVGSSSAADGVKIGLEAGRGTVLSN